VEGPYFNEPGYVCICMYMYTRICLYWYIAVCDFLRRLMLELQYWLYLLYTYKFIQGWLVVESFCQRCIWLYIREFLIIWMMEIPFSVESLADGSSEFSGITKYSWKVIDRYGLFNWFFTNIGDVPLILGPKLQSTQLRGIFNNQRLDKVDVTYI
jgi:hypothetical protein